MGTKKRRVPRGSFLVAVPQMLDPNFMHALVFLIEHEDAGAYGLVVNRPLGVTVDHLLPESALLAGSRFPVHGGGPVGNDTLQFLHRLPEAIPGGVELAAGLFLGGDALALERAIADGSAGPDGLRLFVGYSGWGAGQLEAELESGSWVVAPAPAELVFDSRSRDVLWRHVLRGLGRDGDGLSRMPPDVSWN